MRRVAVLARSSGSAYYRAGSRRWRGGRSVSTKRRKILISTQVRPGAILHLDLCSAACLVSIMWTTTPSGQGGYIEPSRTGLGTELIGTRLRRRPTMSTRNPLGRRSARRRGGDVDASRNSHSDRPPPAKRLHSSLLAPVSSGSSTSTGGGWFLISRGTGGERRPGRLQPPRRARWLLRAALRVEVLESSSTSLLSANRVDHHVTTPLATGRFLSETQTHLQSVGSGITLSSRHQSNESFRASSS